MTVIDGYNILLFITYMFINLHLNSTKYECISMVKNLQNICFKNACVVYMYLNIYEFLNCINIIIKYSLKICKIKKYSLKTKKTQNMKSR